jgi:hypothetical protein
MLLLALLVLKLAVIESDEFARKLAEKVLLVSDSVVSNFDTVIEEIELDVL